ncbi:Uncharacterized protein PHSC3_000934 [Chlamydiales bacterium STE3]|nr:Uncharacterized protein PHSC3_000934 [Chlamydiales bacterium STE3]
MNLQNWITGDSFYWFCALAGTGLFVIQFCLNLMGLDDQEDVDDNGIDDSRKFKWLSRQALTGFLMMFGWSALTCQKEFDLEGAPRFGIALLCGFIAIFATAFIFKIAKRLHSNGTVFKIEDAIGREAVVYQRIPRNGIGKVSVCVENFVREIDACANDRREVPSFVRVKIINKADDKTVVVEIIQD